MEKYQIGRSIGHGSSGEVFLCKHKQENKFYVVKKFRMFDDDSTRQTRQCIQNELKLLQRFRHTNIVSYKDNFSDAQGNLYIVMMYCEDGDMGKKIQLTKQKGKTIHQSQLLDWLVQIALAIYYLHSQNIIHRDIKPQNIFLKNQRIRLGDFGIAKMVDSTNLTATCIGTPYYMSPQVLKRKPYSYKSDIWSFGCILYQMCNLRRPFQANNQFSLSTKIWKGSYPSINAIYSKQLRDLISELLTVNPAKRPTIVDILNKPFLKKRVQNYIQNILNRNHIQVDVDDIFADTLKQQAVLLKIDVSGGQVLEPLKKYPSSKDVTERNRFNRSKRESEQDENQNMKRKSVYNKDTVSLQKCFNKKQKSTQASSKAISYYPNEKDQKNAFIDHKRKLMIDKQSQKSFEKNSLKESESKQIKSKTQKTQEQENQLMDNNSSKKFQFQEEYGMYQQKQYQLQSSSSEDRQSIIIQQDQESVMGNTSQVQQFIHKSEGKPNTDYYKLLNHKEFLVHKCQTGLGKPQYRRLYHSVVTNCDKDTIDILGVQNKGYWHIVDCILLYEGILKGLVQL